VTSLTEHIQLDVPRYGECARQITAVDGVERCLQSRCELPIAWRVRRNSPRDLQRRRAANAALAAELGMDDSSESLSLAADVEPCESTAGASTRTAVLNGRA
jgi:hypothetical protein